MHYSRLFAKQGYRVALEPILLLTITMSNYSFHINPDLAHSGTLSSVVLNFREHDNQGRRTESGGVAQSQQTPTRGARSPIPLHWSQISDQCT